MNLPNKLTILRIMMIPVFVIIFYLPMFNKTVQVFEYDIRLANLIALVIFSLAAYTDRLDGQIARKHGLVTTFGKFMDPLADKLLVMSALLIAVELRLMPAFVPILIISREFMVTGIRLLAISEGKVIAASPLGKLKTVFQIIMIVALLIFDLRPAGGQSYILFSEFSLGHIVVDSLIGIATLLTIVSGYDYFAKNKHIILASK